MSANLTIPQRYLPIQDYQIPSIFLNTSIRSREGNASETSLVGGAAGAFYQDLSTIVSLAILLLIAVISVAYILMITAIPRIPSNTAEISREFPSSEERVDLYGGYSYHGIKLTLRKIYLSLRRSSGCGRCTPRELVLSGHAPGFFADIYEDIVYGEVMRDDVEHALKRLRETIGGDNG
ncbi:hypothetical protein ATG_08080 [Desulfurococcaceae archaeon AG1]|jgi:hypothetical protein|nr:MAG: hypothetical protein DJ555_04110 [Desulfurococcaceae archaeon]GAY25605.1 hypothetical protein ATG_08080 [Desulfurococcaceae archaeon AG1]